MHNQYKSLIAEATELLRNAEYADGQATVMTQDCEALQAALDVIASYGGNAPIRTPIINCLAIGKRCGYGEGGTREESIAAALLQAQSSGYAGAKYNPDTESVEFYGEVKL